MTVLEFLVGAYGPPVGRSLGLSLLRHDTNTDRLTATTVANVDSPSWIATHKQFVYCVGESLEGTVSAFRWSSPRRDRLIQINQRSTHGSHPCHLTIHPDGYLLSTNYTSGSLVVHSLNNDGSIGRATSLHHFGGHGPQIDRQDRSHAHMGLPPVRLTPAL